jgi:hypothetical protein
MSDQIIEVDFTPIYEFHYCQIPNFEYCFLLIDEQNRALHSPFECKDYLQDMFYCEYEKKAAGIWGIHWKPGMINMDVEKFRVVLMGGGEILEPRIAHLKEFLNAFDTALGFELSEVYPTKSSERIVVEFDKRWTQNGPLLSAYMTLLRLYGLYEGGDVREYLKKLELTSTKNASPNFMQKDVSNMIAYHGASRYAALLDGKIPESKWSDFNNMTEVHDTGVFGFKNFPTSEL